MPPTIARLLGFAGLLPHIAVVLILLERNNELRFFALSMGYAYATLILSFLGGMWWGFAARAERAPVWLWVAAVVPSLIALASFLPWATGEPWPGPSLIALGVALLASLGVDWQLQRMALVPDWWLRLRLPLSIGLGGLTLAMAAL